VDERKIPPVWDQVTPRDLSEFERLTLEIKPMTDDQCWEDALSQKEENRANAEAAGRGKRRGAPDGAGGADASPPESPPPPNGVAPRSRKSARIIAKVNRGAHGGRPGAVHGRAGAPAQGGRAVGAEEKPEGDVPDGRGQGGAAPAPAGVHGEDRVLPRQGGGEGGTQGAEGSAHEEPRESEIATTTRGGKKIRRTRREDVERGGTALETSF